MKKSSLAIARELYESDTPFALVQWVKKSVCFTDYQASYLIQVVHAYSSLVHKHGTRDVDKKLGAAQI